MTKGSVVGVDSLALFDEVGPILSPPIPKGLSRRKRRTALALRKLELGRHPLTGLPLHEQAPLFVIRQVHHKRAKPLAFTCGSCAHLHRVIFAASSALDCDLAVADNSAKAWYPGCAQWKPIPQ